MKKGLYAIVFFSSIVFAMEDGNEFSKNGRSEEEKELLLKQMLQFTSEENLATSFEEDGYYNLNRLFNLSFGIDMQSNGNSIQQSTIPNCRLKGRLKVNGRHRRTFVYLYMCSIESKLVGENGLLDLSQVKTYLDNIHAKALDFKDESKKIIIFISILKQ